MFKLISPVSKIVALALSATVTWSLVAVVVEGFQGHASTSPQMAELPAATITGQREPLVAKAPRTLKSTTAI